ncbi:MAG: winged helix-turn-helix domain-containing protein [Candidatus Paceibacterota bacterium]|jgi:DNA-binding transcriptional ArsR family regulator
MISLDELDNKILAELGKKPSYPSKISRKLGVLRTTIHYRLSKLAGAGLAKKIIDGRKSIWSPIYKNTHNKNLYRVYEGRKIVQAYRQLLNLPRQTIVFVIQGSGAAKSELDNLPPLFIKEAHRILKKKEIIMKGILNEKTLSHFDQLGKDLVDSHIGRPQGIKMFSGDEFISNGEIMSTDKFLLLSNPQSGHALIIKDHGITKIINDMFKTLFDLLDGNKTFDLNYYLKNKIK